MNLMVAVLALFFLQGDGWEDLRHPARAVREEAIERAVTPSSGPSTAQVVVWLGSSRPRLSEAAIRILGWRRDPAGWAPLAARAVDDDRAADALVAWAFAVGRPLPLKTPGAESARLELAARRGVWRALESVRGGASVDRPQKYRGLDAAGAVARAELIGIAQDGRRDPALRTHAMHALARLFGRPQEPVLFALAADPEPRVRDEAIRLLWRHNHAEIRDVLARRFESDRSLTRAERDYGAAASRALRRLGPRGEKRLLRELGWSDPLTALRAARILVLLRPDQTPRVHRRLRAMLKIHEQSGGRLGLALWWTQLGPFDDGLRKRFLAGDPLLAAAAAKGRDEALPLLEAALAPELMTPAALGRRLRVGSELLRRWKAPAQARVAFAARAFAQVNRTVHGWGLSMLRGVKPARWQALRSRVEEFLRSPSERVRLEAAALLVPTPAARRVCLESLVNGDPAAARRVAAILARWYRFEANAPVAVRRQKARAWLKALARSGSSDKE